MPYINRFISADTIVPDPAEPQSFNRYSYALNNPVKYHDPTGHCAEQGDESCWEVYHQIWRYVMSNPDRFFSDESSVWNDPNWWIDELAARSEENLQNVYDILAESKVYDVGERPQSETQMPADYLVAQFGIRIGTAALIRDKYGNVYFSAGLSPGAGDLIGIPEVDLAMGNIIAEQLPGGRWQASNDPSEEELRQFLSGWSGSVSGGLFMGGDLATNISFTDPPKLSLNLGWYAPDLGIEITYGGILYDAQTGKYFFQ